MATDLEVGIRYRVLGVKVDQPGAVILPTQRMQLDPPDQRPTRSWPSRPTDDQLIVRGLHAEFKLPSEDPTCIPEVPDFAATGYHVVAAADLKRLIRRTIFATDVESTRYALGGVLVELTARVDHHGRHRRPPPGPDGRPGRGRGRRRRPRRQPGGPGQGPEADRAEPRRRRPARPPGHPVGRGRADPHRAGRDLQPAGRGPVPPLPGRLPGQRRRQDPAGGRPAALGRRAGVDRHQRGEPRASTSASATAR